MTIKTSFGKGNAKMHRICAAVINDNKTQRLTTETLTQITCNQQANEQNQETYYLYYDIQSVL